MIKTIKYGLITWLIVIATNLYGQNGFLSANHSYQIEGNELRVYLEANFSLGNVICDYLDTCIANINNDTILIDAVYDISGFNPQVGCTDYDTIDYNVPDGNYTLLINSKIIFVDSVNNLDTINVSSQLFLNLTLAINEVFFVPYIRLYPNPAKDVLQIEVSEEIQIDRIEFFSGSGKKLKSFTNSEKELDISEFGSGIYYLKISIDKDDISKKVLIE